LLEPPHSAANRSVSEALDAERGASIPSRKVAGSPKEHDDGGIGLTHLGSWQAVLVVVAGASGVAACSSSDRDATSPPPQPARAAATSAASSPPELSSTTRASTEAPTFDDASIDWQATPVMRTLGGIRQSLKFSEYSHSQRVDEKHGIYIFDCSSLAHWALKRATPVAASSIAAGLAGRPLAADYQRRIARVKAGAERGGWQRVGKVQDARPGDVVAWLKPKIIQSANTGHVAFVALPPERAPGYADAYLVRIVDASSLLHADDTRTYGSGFGLGTILLVSDDAGAPRAYSWVGLQWRAFETEIAIGRPTR
jgi:hypothetical protein